MVNFQKLMRSEKRFPKRESSRQSISFLRQDIEMKLRKSEMKLYLQKPSIFFCVKIQQNKVFSINDENLQSRKIKIAGS